MTEKVPGDATVVAPRPPEERDRVGRYLLRDLLGEGAMGRVYLAFDPVIERQVALKVIHAHWVNSDQGEEILLRFRREAKAAGRLSHPNIVAVYEYGEDGDDAFIAMEYVEGKSLKARLMEGWRPGLDETLALMTQLLDALDYAHRHGVVHRDVKPANIMVLEDGRIKITDFGIAHLDDSRMTRTGVMMGSPAYMAPEQCLGLPVDGRADVFSAAVVLYELLTGERPFVGQQATTIVQRILTAEPDPPSKLNPLLPKALDSVVLKALAKKPEDRYADAAGFRQALAEALHPPPSVVRRRLLPVLLSLFVVGVMLSLGGVVHYLYFREIPSSPQVVNGRLKVRSRPDQVLVLVDGERFLGVTPWRSLCRPGITACRFASSASSLWNWSSICAQGMNFRSRSN